MANIVQSPFYVPRPAEDRNWYAAPCGASDIINTLQLSQVKFYGRNGQAPTEQWQYNYFDLIGWFKPTLDVPQTLTLPKKSPFTADQTTFNIFEQPVWQRANYNPLSITMVTYNFGAVDIQFNGYFLEWDGSAQSQQTNLSLGIVPAVAPVLLRSPFYVPRQNEINSWQRTAPKSITAQATVNIPTLLRAPFFVPKQNEINNWAKIPSKSITATTVATSTPRSPLYVPRQNEINNWQWKVPNPLSITLVSYNFSSIDIQFNGYFLEWDGSAQSQQTNLSLGIVPAVAPTLLRAPLYISKPQDQIVWQKSPQRDLTLSASLAVGTPLKAKQWSWNNNDASVWWRWVNRDLVIGTFQPPPLLPGTWDFNNNESPSWFHPAQRSINLNAVAPVTYVPRAPFYTSPLLDNYSVWQPISLSNVSLPYVPNVVNRYHLDIPSDHPWSMTIKGISAAVIPATPNLINHWWLDIPGDHPWTLTARTIAPPPTPSLVNRWRLDIPADQPWAVSIKSVSPPSVPGIARNRRRVDFPADGVWSFSGRADIALTATPFAGARPLGAVLDDNPWARSFSPPIAATYAAPLSGRAYRFTADDLSGTGWTGSRIKLPIVPVIANRRQLGLPDTKVGLPEDNIWLKSKYFNYAITKNIPESFIIRQPSFANDDFAVYQWKVRNPIITSLKWDTSLDRIACAAAELRVVDVPAEKRIAGTASENRIGDTNTKKDCC